MLRIIALIVGLMPGFGHIWVGRVKRGLAIFFLFANGVNAYFVGRFLWERQGSGLIEYAGLAVAVAAFLFSHYDLFKITRKPAKQPEPAKEPEPEKPPEPEHKNG
jgi:hypothetical protein